MVHELLSTSRGSVRRAGLLVSAVLVACLVVCLTGCASAGGGAGAPLVEMRFESGWAPSSSRRQPPEGDGLVTLRPRDRRATTFQLAPERLGAVRAAVDALRLERRTGISNPGKTDDLALILLRTPTGLAEVRVEAPRQVPCTAVLQRVAPIWNTLIDAARLHYEGRGDRMFGFCDGRGLES